MIALYVLAALAVGAMGFAIQRGGTCTVAAVDEVLSQRRAHRLAAMFEASLWVAGGLAIAQLLHVSGSMPGGVAIDAWTVAGGVLLGLGAWINAGSMPGGVAIDGWTVAGGVLLGLGDGSTAPACSARLRAWARASGRTC